MLRIAVVFGLALSIIPSLGHAKDKIKIGFITTLSGPNAELGQEMSNAFKLAVQSLGGKVGGLPTEIITGDDESKADVGRKIADKMVEDDHVDVITGIVYSNVVQALAKPVLDSGTILVSGNANTPQLAGAECRPNFFSLAAQLDTLGEIIGIAAQKNGYKRVYVLAGNYVAGRAPVEGFKRDFKGEVVGEAYPPLGQLDFAVEIAQLKAAKPDAVYSGFTGGMVVAFVKQYTQAGLMKELPFISVWGAYEPFSQLEAAGESAVGARGGAYYHWQLDNPANKHFVADFEKAYHAKPGHVAASEYDAVNLLDSAVRAVNGKIEDKTAFSAAIKQAKFASVRGPSFKFNNNNFPILNYYETVVVKAADGKIETRLGDILARDLPDFYAKDCPIK